MLKHCLAEALRIKKSPKTTVCSICKYVDDKRQQVDESLEFTPEKYIPSLHCL